MIIVTGATRGIGSVIASRLLDEGHEVIGLVRESGNYPFETMICDVRDSAAINENARALRKANRTVFGLVNCAGVAAMNLALTTPATQVKTIIETNLFGTIYTCQAFSPLMIRNGGGRIINFSTIAVRLGLAGESIYSASKAGVEAFSRSFAREMASFKISVNCVAPGPIRTDLLRGLTEEQIDRVVRQQIIPRAHEPSDVADLVSLILSSEAGSLSGQTFHVGGV